MTPGPLFHGGVARLAPGTGTTSGIADPDRTEWPNQ